MSRWRPIGVIGGMGPAATVDFLDRLVRAIPAEDDSAHPRVFVDMNPHVPSRNDALSGKGPSPAPALAAMARGLAAQGAEVLAMPCNAAHGWADAIRAATPLPFVDMVEETARRAAGVRTVGLIAVRATCEARLYHAPLEATGASVLTPGADRVAALVARVKAGDTGAGVRAEAAALAAELAARGAGIVIAACTEIPLVLADGDCPVPLLASTDVLVDAVLRAAARA